MKFHLYALSLCAALSCLSLAVAADAPATQPAAAAVTLKGTMECAKCELHETDKCANVLVVKTGDKTEKYYMTDDATAQAAHGDICMAPKDGVSCTGSITTDKDGKKWITCTSVDAPK